MIEDTSLFSFFTLSKRGCVLYGDNNKIKIIGNDIVSKFSNPTIEEVLLVNGLKYNLLSISQLHDKGNNITIDSFGWMVIKSKSNQNIFTSSRSGNTYIANLNKIPLNDICILINEDESRLYHKRVAHINMDNLNKLVCKNLVTSLLNFSLKNKGYGACQNVNK